MIAPSRPRAASSHLFSRASLWARAAEIRRDWLAIGLSTEPADRPAAEQAITEIYARHRRRRPEFRWVDSPREALSHLAGLPTHETLRTWLDDRRPPGLPPIASDIAAGLARLRSVVADSYTEPAPDRPPMKRDKAKPWPALKPADALDAGMPFLEILRQGVRESLFRSLAGIYLPIRAELLARPLPVGWYGHQDASWVAYFDVQRRLGLARTDDGGAFDTWVRLTRAAGWWWPGETQCVLVERPASLHTEPIPGAWQDEVRLSPSPNRPSVVYRDGWSIVGVPAG